MRDVTYDPDAEKEYECVSCGTIVTGPSLPGECPDCGSIDLMNRGMPVE